MFISKINNKKSHIINKASQPNLHLNFEVYFIQEPLAIETPN